MNISKHALNAELSELLDLEIELDNSKFDEYGNRVHFFKDEFFVVRANKPGTGFVISLLAELSELTDNKVFKIDVHYMYYFEQQIELSIEYKAIIKKALLQIFY